MAATATAPIDAVETPEGADAAAAWIPRKAQRERWRREAEWLIAEATERRAMPLERPERLLSVMERLDERLAVLEKLRDRGDGIPARMSVAPVSDRPLRVLAKLIADDAAWRLETGRPEVRSLGYFVPVLESRISFVNGWIEKHHRAEKARAGIAAAAERRERMARQVERMTRPAGRGPNPAGSPPAPWQQRPGGPPTGGPGWPRPPRRD